MRDLGESLVSMDVGTVEKSGIDLRKICSRNVSDWERNPIEIVEECEGNRSEIDTIGKLKLGGQNFDILVDFWFRFLK